MDIEAISNLNQRFKKGKLMGKGGFGEAYEITEEGSNEKYAAKIYFDKIDSEEVINELKNELPIFSKLNHPSIIKLKGYSLKDFDNNSCPTIIMELAENGSLRDPISSALKGESVPQWTNTKKLINIYGIASGMQYLHSNNVIHRDLKPENILLNEYLYPKITDFGLSRICRDAAEIQNFSIKGTYKYMSPEAFDGEFSEASDVYSYSIIIYEILTNKRIFPGLNQPKAMLKIFNEGFIPIFPKNFPESYKNLILECGSKDFKKRPKFSDIIEKLLNDESFILPDVDVEFKNYVDFIKEAQISFFSKSLVINFDDYIEKKTSIQKVTLKTISTTAIKKYLYPYELYMKLSPECQKQVQRAENDPEIQYFVGKSCIEGENGFPIDPQIGLTYIKSSRKLGCDASILYNASLLISGKKIMRDLDKAQRLLDQVKEKSGEYYFLRGKVMRKKGDFENARKFFMKGIKKLNVRAILNYGKMLLYGEGGIPDKEGSLEYFKMAKGYNCKKADDFIGLINYDKTHPALEQKVLLLGDSMVGKTLLLNSLEFKPFMTAISTIGFDYRVVFYGRSDGITIKLIVTDTVGQERFRNTITPKMYRDAGIIFLCYNNVPPNTDQSVHEWMKKIKENNPDCSVILIETQADKLSIEQKEARKKIGLKLKTTYGAYEYVLTSSKTKEGIKNVLKHAADLAVPITNNTTNNVDNNATNSRTVKLEVIEPEADDKKKKKSGCC